jgi:hypothetical protein
MVRDVWIESTENSVQLVVTLSLKQATSSLDLLAGIEAV